MSNISKIAAEIVFILVAITVCFGFLIGKLPVESFMILAGGAFTFYFTKTAPENSKEKQTQI